MSFMTFRMSANSLLYSELPNIELYKPILILIVLFLISDISRSHHKKKKKNKDKNQESEHPRKRRPSTDSTASLNSNNSKSNLSTISSNSNDSMKNKFIQNKENCKEIPDVKLKENNIEILNNNSNSNDQSQVTTSIQSPNNFLLSNYGGKLIPNEIMSNGSPIEVKKQDVFIKKEYLPAPPKILKILPDTTPTTSPTTVAVILPPQPVKTREDVTRTLNFNNNNIVLDEKSIKKEASEITAQDTKQPTHAKLGVIQEDKSNLLENGTDIKIKSESIPIIVEKKEPTIVADTSLTSMNKPLTAPAVPSTPNKIDVTSDTNSNEIKAESKSKSSYSNHKSSTSSSSSHKHGSSSSSRDCSRCYKRSKTKRCNIGIQCKRDTTGVAPNATTASTKNNFPNLKYGKYFHVDVHPNGGASTIHLYQNEINNITNKDDVNEMVDEFFKAVFSEDENGFAHYVMGIVHDAASYLPDLLEHMAENYANLTVKSGVLGRNSDIETCTMSQYNEQVTIICKLLNYSPKLLSFCTFLIG